MSVNVSVTDKGPSIDLAAWLQTPPGRHLLAWEQALIIGTGTLAGTLIGVSASNLFIPFLQVRAGPHPNTPPFVVQIAWDRIGIIYLVFGVMLLLAVVVMLALLRRMKLFQAVKLGEAI